MSCNQKVLAVIPARGGSKRLPRKNILPLNGKPLIAWTIEAAFDSGIFDEVMVNTDDHEIAEVAVKFGAQVPFIRPSELAEDMSSSIDVITHTLKWYQEKGIEFTDVVLLQPTSPLREKSSIIGAWELYQEPAVESVVSVCEVEHPIQWTYKIDNNGFMCNLFEDHDKRSQDYEKQYRLNGAIYITTAHSLLAKNKLISTSSSVAYLMTNELSIDIDNKKDFELAEFYLSYPSNNTSVS